MINEPISTAPPVDENFPKKNTTEKVIIEVCDANVVEAVKAVRD